MSIELLYIVPIIALSLLLFFNLLARQKKSLTRSHDESLVREVEAFNVGMGDNRTGVRQPPEARIGDIEKTITLVSQRLSSQQKLIDGFQGSNRGYASEIDGLKSRLLDLQKEYDITLSENYSLRAKMRKLEERINAQSPTTTVPVVPRVAPADAAPPTVESRRHQSESAEARKQLYGDTEVFGATSMDDTTELELPQSGRAR
jgi:archaellum component FlaC